MSTRLQGGAAGDARVRAWASPARRAHACCARAECAVDACAGAQARSRRAGEAVARAEAEASPVRDAG